MSNGRHGAARGIAAGVGAAALVGVLGLGVLLPRLDPQRESTSQPAPATSSPTAATNPAPGANPTGAPTPDPAQSSGQADVKKQLRAFAHRTPNDPRALGRTDAKVVMIEWSDFRCPFCASWAKTTKPALQKYIDDGTLRIEYRDLPLFGEQSVTAAQAGWAAAAQGKFWPFIDKVYAKAPAQGHPDLPKATLLAYAKEVGVPDLAKFEKDMASKEAKAKVQKDASEAQQLGAQSVPVFLVGAIPIAGAQPAAEFEKAIRAEAAQQR